MRIRAFWVAIFVCGVAGQTRPAVAQVDQQRAQAYFKEAQALCARDGGRLWGVSVCAPILEEREVRHAGILGRVKGRNSLQVPRAGSVKAPASRSSSSGTLQPSGSRRRPVSGRSHSADSGWWHLYWPAG